MLLKRTTLRLEEEIYRLAKKRAVDEGVTLQELVNRVLRRYLVREKGGGLVEKERRLKLGGFDVGRVKEKIERRRLYGEVF